MEIHISEIHPTTTQRLNYCPQILHELPGCWVPKNISTGIFWLGCRSVGTVWWWFSEAEEKWGKAVSPTEWLGWGSDVMSCSVKHSVTLQYALVKVQLGILAFLEVLGLLNGCWCVDAYWCTVTAANQILIKALSIDHLWFHVAVFFLHMLIPLLWSQYSWGSFLDWLLIPSFSWLSVVIIHPLRPPSLSPWTTALNWASQEVNTQLQVLMR
jgi:hypothetical protein